MRRQRMKCFVALPVMIAGSICCTQADATPPQDPYAFIYNVEPENLSKVRDEIDITIGKLAEDLRAKPAEITPETFELRMDRVAKLAGLVQVRAQGEIRVMSITGRVDGNWESKAWKPLSETALLCGEVCDWLKANGEDVLKKVDRKNVEQISKIEGVETIDGLKRQTVELVALMAKCAKRNDCVEDFFTRLGGAILICSA